MEKTYLTNFSLQNKNTVFKMIYFLCCNEERNFKTKIYYYTIELF